MTINYCMNNGLMKDNDMHRCSICNSTEVENEFHNLGLNLRVDSFYRDGLDVYCNQCAQEIQDTISQDNLFEEITEEVFVPVIKPAAKIAEEIQRKYNSSLKDEVDE